MIFDRTQSDIDNANAIRENKIKNLVELTDDDIKTLEKGFLTVATLTRIEDKQIELKQLFNAMGYWNTNIKNRAWLRDYVFTLSDHERIINNENILRNAFFVYSDTPNTPDVAYGFEDINSLEKILYDLDVMINDVRSNYRECGNYNCGED